MLSFPGEYALVTAWIYPWPRFPLFLSYTIGPVIPYPELGCNSQEKTNSDNDLDDIQWLDSQPVDFVLNISLGSFLSVSSAQMDEILAGLQMSGVRFLRVARGEASRLNQTCGDTGQILPWSWCDQLRISWHSSAGGFLTHRGSNSILKIFMLALLCSLFLFSLDQHPNSNQIVGNWKIGKRMKKEIGTWENLLIREQIVECVGRFMDLESNEGKEMRRVARQFRDNCRGATAEGG